mmetsp:Transcript_21814/g.28130  ORF Transcript_21814/g.28130 Transcript_21814/m.28130 type:complete len:82 (+) Transcript_21814:202-447(+)
MLIAVESVQRQLIIMMNMKWPGLLFVLRNNSLEITFHQTNSHLLFFRKNRSSNSSKLSFSRYIGHGSVIVVEKCNKYTKSL